MKIEFSCKRREMILFSTINKDAVTSPANQQYFIMTFIFSFFFVLFNIGLLLTNFHFDIYVYFPDLETSFDKPLGFDSSDIPLPAYHSSNYLNFLYLMSQNKQTELN